LPFGKTSFACILYRIINPILALIHKSRPNCVFDSCNTLCFYIYLTKFGAIILFFSDFIFMNSNYLDLCLIEIESLFDDLKID